MTRFLKAVTIAALAALGDADLLSPYLRRGVDAGFTRDEIVPALTAVPLGLRAAPAK